MTETTLTRRRATFNDLEVTRVRPLTDDAVEVTFAVPDGLADDSAPTFAAVHGACLGVGLGLAIATDVVYVAEDATLGSPFANLGATLDSGGHWLFTERLGAHRTLDLIYTAEFMTGAEAVTAGLFSRAVPAGELVEFTRARVRKAAQGATQAFLVSRELVADIRDRRIGLWSSVEAENVAQGRLCSSADYLEGFRAFQEKRRPEFTGGR